MTILRDNIKVKLNRLLYNNWANREARCIRATLKGYH